MRRVVLVTGAMGCIGAWCVRHLLENGAAVVAFDLAQDDHRLRDVVPEELLSTLIRVRGDLTAANDLADTIAEHGVTQVIHLAALQVPFCRADPPLGSRVNVEGTIRVFEAARAAGIEHLAYASSIAVYGPASDYDAEVLDDSMPKRPGTVYGVTKVANELTAGVYWHDHGISSVALRPYTVYGVGRDQGLTSEPTLAMAAVARGEDGHVSFGGRMQFHYASDVARQFIDAAATRRPGAHVYDLGGPIVAVEEVARLIETLRPERRVTVGDTPLPFAAGFDDAALRRDAPRVFETPLEEGVRATIEHFEALAR
jgi:nucleoside-diphosphate-sugar epimerase